MQVGWQDHLSKGDDCGVHIASLGFEPEQTFAAFSVVRRPARTFRKTHQRASVESVTLSKKIPTAEGRPNRVQKWDWRRLPPLPRSGPSSVLPAPAQVDPPRW